MPKVILIGRDRIQETGYIKLFDVWLCHSDREVKNIVSPHVDINFSIGSFVPKPSTTFPHSSPSPLLLTLKRYYVPFFTHQN